jgi:hypothetical protein
MTRRSRTYPPLEPEAPLACDVFLSADPVQDRRLAELWAHRSAPPRDDPETGSVELRFRGIPWELAEAFIEHERRCCAFLGFELREQQDELVLRVWGRRGIHGVLRGELAEP